MITLVGLVPALLILNWGWRLSFFVFACAGAIFLIIYVFMRPSGAGKARSSARSGRRAPS